MYCAVTSRGVFGQWTKLVTKKEGTNELAGKRPVKIYRVTRPGFGKNLPEKKVFAPFFSRKKVFAPLFFPKKKVLLF